MKKQLANGVHLNILPSKQFKTNRIQIKFITPLKKEILAKRTLLSSLLETSSTQYSDQNKVAQKLADLYGAGFSIDVQTKGKFHIMEMGMNLVNEAYLTTNQPLINEAIAFLREMIYEPLTSGATFDDETFKHEKENMAVYVQSVYDNKQAYAGQKSNALYFSEQADYALPSYGDLTSLEAITNPDLYAYYQEMLVKDAVEIYVQGDVDEAEVIQAFEKYAFTDRVSSLEGVFIERHHDTEITRVNEEQEITQAKLNMLYSSPVTFHDDHYFPSLVANGIFGGSPLSKLFVNVREKASLAYYASSSLDTFKGKLTVQSGIESKNQEAVEKIVTQQLEDVIAGEFSEELMGQIKSGIENQFLLGLDSQNAIIANEFVKTLVPTSELSQEEWLRRLQAVTKEEVQEAAKSWNLQVVYCLREAK